MRLASIAAGAGLLLGLAGALATTGSGDEMSGYRELSPEEEYVIVHGGTEAPYTGEYEDHWEEGTYVCRRCGAGLYESTSKFDSGCGWPAFDDEIEGAVERRTDADGFRTEILCAECGAHLGHVFEGEGFTETDTRHCVNSISMDFVPAGGTETAIFAGGCFWGIEHAFGQVEGVLETTVGYTGGDVENPTYEDVCAGGTGHAEAVRVEFDSSVVSYEQLARLFFELHDPTSYNRQGLDVGSQYRSAVFVGSDEQRETIEHLVELLEQGGYNVVTQVEEAGEFWPAEQYHQDYLQRRGGGSYCHVRTERFDD